MDFQIGHNRPWLTVGEIARALEVSEDHVCNLFAGPFRARENYFLDFVVDVSVDGSGRPRYRILREAWENFQTARRFTSNGIVPHPNYDDALSSHMRRLPAVMGASHVAGFLSICENQARALGNYFLDAGAASQTCFRASKTQLLNFIQRRKL